MSFYLESLSFQFTHWILICECLLCKKVCLMFSLYIFVFLVYVLSRVKKRVGSIWKLFGIEHDTLINPSRLYCAAINVTQNIEDEEYGEENYVRMYQVKGTYPSRSPNALRYIKHTKSKWIISIQHWHRRINENATLPGIPVWHSHDICIMHWRRFHMPQCVDKTL